MATTSRRPRGEIPRLPSNPLPWTVQGPIPGECVTRKSDGRPEYSNIIDRNGLYVAEFLDPDVAELIVKAVNAYRKKPQEVFVCPACGGVCVAEAVELKEAAKEAQAKETQAKEAPTCDDCEHCDGGVRAKIIDYDTGETMPWGQCSVHVFCNGDICANFKQKEGA